MNTQVLPVLIRREFWEHRVLWMAPVILTALYIAGCLVLGGSSLHTIQIDMPSDGSKLGGHFLFLMIQVASTGLLFALMSVVIFFYLSDCLYAERKDRSILFWKSLPVSDAATVISKLIVALLIVPFGMYVLGAVANLLAFVILSVWVRGNPFLQQFLQWDTGTWLKLNGLLLLDLVVVALWYAPVAAYQLLISAWARTGVFVWTLLPPLALSLGEYAVFRTWHIGKILLGWIAFTPPISGPVPHITVGANDTQAVNALLKGVNALPLLLTPEMWIGVVVAAGMIFAAIRLRRQRDVS